MHDIVKSTCANFVAYSIAVDESTDCRDTSQLCVFISGINSNFHVFEELLKWYPWKEDAQNREYFKRSKLHKQKITLHSPIVPDFVLMEHPQ